MARRSNRTAPGLLAGWTLEDLYTILDALPTPISWASHPDHVIRFVNRAFTTCLGYRLEDLSTVAAWANDVVANEEHRALGHVYWQTIWQDGTHRALSMPGVEIDLRTRNGNTVTMQMRGIFLPDLGISLAVFEDVAVQKLEQKALRRIALEDALTGIGNRRALQDVWHRLIEADAPADDVVLLLIDLDGFKNVNDCWGHDAGDQVLKTTTARLRAALPPGATLFRTGGDEFTLLLSAPARPQDVEKLYGNIQAAISTPFLVSGEVAQLAASVGASRCPRHGARLRDMMRRADQALYYVKRNGKHGFAWHEAIPAEASPARGMPGRRRPRHGVRTGASAPEPAPPAPGPDAQDRVTLTPVGAT